jgi:hypothetical protein
MAAAICTAALPTPPAAAVQPYTDDEAESTAENFRVDAKSMVD